MRRHPKRVALIAAGVIVFLGISVLLARFLSLENVERSDILGVLTAEAHGDGAAMLAALHGCGGHCRAVVMSDARQLRRAGAVLIVADQSPTAYALTSATGFTRIAWKVSGRLPIVQCVKVSRSGNALSGLTIRLLSVSAPIPLTADCP